MTKEERAAYMREWRKTDAHKKQRNSAVWKWGVWKNNLRIRYSVTPDWVGERFLEQQGKCAICDHDIYYNVWGVLLDKTFSIHIDHDHVTGRPRGLLCQNCNIALGKFEDSQWRLGKAITYLAYDEQ